MKKCIFLIALFSLGLAFSVSAQTGTPKVTKRQVAQKNRIQNGVQNGELTKGEVAQLGMQQRSINRSKKRAKADGQVTKKERAILHKRQNHANRNIKRKKHNGRDRN